MAMKALHEITRRTTRRIRVGRLTVGGDAPISVQTMTNTGTENGAATVAQIRAARAAGRDTGPGGAPALMNRAFVVKVNRLFRL